MSDRGEPRSRPPSRCSSSCASARSQEVQDLGAVQDGTRREIKHALRDRARPRSRTLAQLMHEEGTSSMVVDAIAAGEAMAQSAAEAVQAMGNAAGDRRRRGAQPHARPADRARREVGGEPGPARDRADARADAALDALQARDPDEERRRRAGGHHDRQRPAAPAAARARARVQHERAHQDVVHQGLRRARAAAVRHGGQGARGQGPDHQRPRRLGLDERREVRVGDLAVPERAHDRAPRAAGSSPAPSSDRTGRSPRGSSRPTGRPTPSRCSTTPRTSSRAARAP